jgi:hypothetical protein
MKRKLTDGDSDGKSSGGARSSKKKSYLKPTPSERVSIKGSALWANLSALHAGKLMTKHISKWTAKEKDSFMREMNKYLAIIMFDDPGEKGNLEDVLSQVSSYLTSGNDEALRLALDPVYLVLDWTQGGIPNGNQLPFPTLENFIFPPKFNMNDIQPIPELRHCYIVSSIRVGEYIMGRVQAQFPGLRGTVLETSIALIIR